MSSHGANHHDVEIALKLYELRREPVMRESRKFLGGEFWPKSYDEAAAIMDPKHPGNAAFRQVSSYWEMVYGFLKHGAVNMDMILESNGEGLFIYAKFEPFIDELRSKNSPTMFTNTRWVIENSPWAAERMKMFSERRAKMIASR